MAEITVSDLRLHELSDHSTYKVLPFSSISLVAEADSAALKMASGRIISVSTPGILKRWNVGLPFSVRADINWLRTRAGDSFMVRTAYGELFFATMNDVNVTEQMLPGIAHDSVVGQVTFTLTEISLTEEV